MSGSPDSPTKAKVLSETLAQFRDQAREQIKREEAARLLKQQRNRFKILKKGAALQEEEKLIEAALTYKNYIKTLEMMKGVPEGGLSPAQFDREKELTELLLVTGTFWDLAKLYDWTKSWELQAEFKVFLNKFVLFAKGMPFQVLCAETARKYIQRNGPRNKKEFVHAYKAIQGSRCFVATELIEFVDPDTIPTLRNFRDRKLKNCVYGRKFVAWYYTKGPRIARAVGTFPTPVKRLLALVLDRIARQAG